ncbi:ubiquinol-cytochrome C chaperone family protein [Rhodospirillum rubrum]|uniref:Ubiquinol-cytochrome C chaperone n=1 Tax=Rhodospirillum rubrum (strain ATCC 11170 / ATH 1.1.1 / DSM 467 / LMG 4362 / NCIMB 8255 / S1) TaxID=269796 RepID=Q2RTT2_RHORT|nr:ubiquinol-cytochrome C chaperone family protein [Rhodospirillum rubrum]ABC22463.1 Ubiquinol-cytochrome C chaperone [Rhodospirillum rubrum ATCC 11170]MBK1664765.1 ubiquinol-cytochrome C chaperone [Rhodospirillum rubrum]MBK1676425.1 ubiquinol-cytochrome C chaperone [Rhodospirillum rubrum]MBK5954045.1 ubiquinol-cytochrome C chaperone [Rhodospirillum rubrum]QXG82095.1 ubiquinol-cytochrome C chaperone family protein [Rhodospirillum rubrum]
MPLPFFQRRRRYEDAAHALYGLLVAKARDGAFYERLGVPDTLDGRYDMIIIHVALLLRRLSLVSPGAPTDRKSPGARLAQEVFDLMFKDMDRNLREMGVSDYKLGKEIKKMARAFYGRAMAYEAGLRDGSLETSLRETVYRTVEADPAQVAGLAAYMRREALSLSKISEDRLFAGGLAFGPVVSADPDPAVAPAFASPPKEA